MAVKIQNELKAVVTVDNEEVTFTLRQPTNKEFNEFQSALYPVGKKNRIQNNSLEARVGFFDKLLTTVENLNAADDTPVTPERKDLIPSYWKGQVVFRLFEDQEVEIKN